MTTASTVTYEELDQLGDLYYQNQLGERGCDRPKLLQDLVPRFPCVRGVIPIGTSSKMSIFDGHKFACGVRAISQAPIVYSFGSNKDQTFEESFLRLRPDAKIFIFEMSKNKLPNKRLPSIEYHVMGLGYRKGSHFRSLRATMQMLNHQYIDVLKVDIEGSEWDFVHEEADLLQNIGQFLVELHLGMDEQSAEKEVGSPRNWLELIENKGNMRLFFKEPNIIDEAKCVFQAHYTELSFIQKNWGVWDKNKMELMLK